MEKKIIFIKVEMPGYEIVNDLDFENIKNILSEAFEKTPYYPIFYTRLITPSSLQEFKKEIYNILKQIDELEKMMK